MPNPASVDDVELRWRPLSDSERVVAQTFLDDAWWMLLGPRYRPTLEADMAAGTVLPRNVARVVATMALRVLKNPDGYDSETIDDYTYRRNSLVSSGALHVTDDELSDLAPAGRARRRSVRLTIYGDD